MEEKDFYFESADNNIFTTDTAYQGEDYGEDFPDVELTTAGPQEDFPDVIVKYPNIGAITLEDDLKLRTAVSQKIDQERFDAVVIKKIDKSKFFKLF